MSRYFRKFLIYFLIFSLCFFALGLYHWQSKIIDYSRLEKSLISHDWFQADRETSNIISTIVRKQVEEEVFFGLSRLNWFVNGVLYSGYMQKEGICCYYLKKINRLWSKYSDGYFGFSTQVKIALPRGQILLFPEEKIEQIPYYELVRRISWEDYNLNQIFGWKGKYFLQNPNNFKNIEPQTKPGFLPSRRWMTENSLGAFGYDVEESIQDFLPCINSEFKDIVLIFYLSDLDKINSLKYKLDNFNKYGQEKYLRRQKCN